MRQHSRAIILMIIAWSAAVAFGQTDIGGPILLPAGVADPAGNIGYFQGKGGGVEAVELATGRQLWTRVESGAPLLVVGDRLLTFAPINAALVMLNRADGKDLKQSDRLEFPRAIVPGSDGHAVASWSFAAEARESRGDCYLLWKGRRPPRPPSGIPVTPIQQKEMIEVFRGAFRIDPQTGKVQKLDLEKLPRELQPLLTTNEQSVLTFHGDDAACAKFVALGLNKLPVRAMYYSTHDTAIAVMAGGAIAAVLLGETGKEDQLKLVHWNFATGKREGGDVALAAGSTDTLAHYRPRLSLDKGYLFVANPFQDKPKLDYSVHDIRTGKRVAQWPQVPFEQAAVVGRRLLILVESQPERPQVVNGPGVHYPRSIRALDFQSGTTLWERPTQPRYSPPMLLVP